MVEPKVISRRNSKGTSDEVMIGRPTKWGNPYSHYPGVTSEEFRTACRDDSIDAYGQWILTQPDLMAALPELAGKTLVCWCKPDRCHGEVLLRLANPGLLSLSEPDPQLF